MRGGYNIHAVRIEKHEKGADGNFHFVEGWHEAASPHGKLHTVCGHKHSSYEEAAVCIPAVEKAYREKRWPAKVAA
jgi:hypothetical protein